jgi:hypothetical protein
VEYYIRMSRNKYFLFVIFLNICNFVYSQYNDIERDFITIEVIFFDYKEESTHYSFFDGSFSWADSVRMKIISKEYENEILVVSIWEYPVRIGFKNEDICKIKISQNILEENLMENKPREYTLIVSTDIKFID